MTLKYLAGSLKEYSSSPKDISVASQTGSNFRTMNFSKSFFTETNDQFSDTITISALGNLSYTKANCADTNCTSCSDIECYTCKGGYYLENGGCLNTTGSQIYFLSPGFNDSDNTPAVVPLPSFTFTTNYTISFFIKYFSKRTSSNTVDIIRIGDSLKIRLNYNTSNGTVALELYSDKDATFCLIANAGNFLPRFGQWTHISLAYYYDFAKLNYYPANLNFQVNFNPIATIFSCYNMAMSSNTNLNISFPSEPIALYASVLIWNKYITGVWGIQTWKNNQKTPSNSYLVSSCLNSTGLTIKCYRDYTAMLKTDDYCDSASFYPGSSCLAAQAKCPFGFFVNDATTDYCSCENKETNTWIVNKTDTRHYCISKLKNIYNYN
jgi:hypothetical protein